MTLDVVCLFEESGFSAKPFAEAGYDVHCYDLENEEGRIELVGLGRIIYHRWDGFCDHQTSIIIGRHFGIAKIVLGFPPCTDLAVSGAAHFRKKFKENPSYREEAMRLVYRVPEVGNALGVPWCLENPVSVISSEWRKPDFVFHPYEFGGYLPEGDEHPKYPDYIAPRDAYPKKTCYWWGNGFLRPEKRPVHCPLGYSAQHRKLGGKSKKTKQIRSASPRGAAMAIYEANK